ncbi:MAG TPA: DUF3090 domain-containing protein [Candidatus Limnocylindria bacterium]|nr:DUF3090 domain-containing protein [Candidatus Limnocylindria bacterium]
MPRRLFRFTAPDRFVAGTIGPPGARSFYLQARQGAALVSLAVEKQQVAALAARMAEVLSSVADPVDPSGPHLDDAPLDEPLVEAFRVGVLALAWDPSAERLVVEAQPISEEGDYVEASDDDPDAPDLFRVSLDPAPARDFVRRAAELVVAGRPTCPFCGQPIDERGHLCARTRPELN